MAWCIQSLLPLLGEDTRLKIISGQANPRNASNLTLIPPSHRAWIEYAIQPDEPWTIMAQCHMAVLASGTTVYEANCCRLPMVLLSLVDNQHAPGQAWGKAQQARYLGPWETVQADTFRHTVAHCLKVLSGGGFDFNSLVDGQGAARVALAVQSHFTRQKGNGVIDA
ncbi:MAG: hypothetical protein EBT70_13500 [Betaproteobacteria bacterium]|nr:hypothetical protein [Betaproteobacteria bacterium]